jgi:hypothetical protein
MRIPHLLIALILFAPTPLVAQEVSISLPLAGNYHAGHYMPVAVTVRTLSRPATLRIKADGAADTVLDVGAGSVELVVPLLVLRAPLGVVSATIDGTTVATYSGDLRSPASGEQLVGMLSAGVRPPQELFPSRNVIPILLDPTAPLRGAGIAWEALNAVVLDGPALARIDATAMDQLLTAGTIVAVRAPKAPAMPAVSWKQSGDFWLGTRPSLGPLGAVVSESAYEPTYGWEPGWPGATRRGIVFAAIAYVGASLLLTLWRTRRPWGAQVLCAAVAVGTVVVWAQRRPAVFEATTGVVVKQGQFEQRDRWAYQASMSGRDGAFRWTGATWPVFASAEQMERVRVELRCDERGMPKGFVYRLPPRGRIGFLSRTFWNSRPDNVERELRLPVTSAASRVARDLYLREDFWIAGQAAGEAGDVAEEARTWPAVVIERGKAP